MAHRIINNEADLAECMTLLANLKLPITLEWRNGRDRSLQQNDTMWMWAVEVERQTQQETADEVQRRWKLELGVPILREESPEFRAFYDDALKGRPYPVKLQAMKYTPITSIMSVRQMSKLLDTIQRECAEQGIRLTDPDPMRKAA